MGESVSPPPMAQGIDAAGRMASLRGRGADRFDPVRFRFIEALARRAEGYRGEARRLLEEKLVAALAEYGARFEEARVEAGGILGRMSARFPDAADELSQAYGAGDFSALRRLAAELESPGACRLLADLIAQMASPAPERVGGLAANDFGTSARAPAELKSLTYFRDTWSKLGVEQQLAEALAQAPENAGPLNSHLLVLESLKRMRDISPDYLGRFMAYVDALLWLDQASGATKSRK
ncbi:MAG: hypothetical protein H6R10_3355 [Rhodocyclaceae bacterium]|nr:hypothetical protein [Rhodocyclaceae bacterium]